MKRVLCPTDFSDVARNATAYAAKLCQSTDSSLMLLNIQSTMALAAIEIINGNSFQERVIAELQQETEQVSFTFKIVCDGAIETSNETIANVIRKHSTDYDLIVMGTHCENDIIKDIFGSNTAKTIAHTSTPLILIPPGCLYSEPQNIVIVSTDLLLTRDTVMQLTQWVASKDPILHVLKTHANGIDYTFDFPETLQVVTHAINAPLTADTINGVMTALDAELLILPFSSGSSNPKSARLARDAAKSNAYPVMVIHQNDIV